MDRFRRRAALVAPFVLALPIGLARAQPRQRPRVGEVTAVTGTALAHFEDLPPRPLAPAAPVLLDDTLATDPDARLACRLAGGLEVRLGGNATLRVDRVTLGGGARAPAAARPGGIGLTSLSGPLLLDRPAAPAARPAPPIALDLPWARIAVRGTRFFAGPLDSVHAVFCERGTIAVTLSATGWQGVLEAGEGVDIPREAGLPPGAPPPSPTAITRWGAPRIARAMALVH
jgi:ferric-dicitrate binding protein FerR (iron transport regulator)